MPSPETPSRFKILSDTLLGLALVLLPALLAATGAFLLVGVAARAWHWMLLGF